ncbi:MAG: TetR/AcrR family transcriptional regulator [Ilumatobacteraceae bacterium]
MPGQRVRPTRAEKVAGNRDALLTSAGRVFRRVGYAGATIDAIADDAGFTKGAVYSHFGSKADLFLTLLEERIEARARRQAAHLEEHRAPDDVATFIEQVWLPARRDRAWRLVVLEFRLVAARDEVLQQRYAAAHGRTLDGVARSIENLFARLDLAPAVPPRQLAALLLALDVGGFLEELVEPDVIPRRDLPGVVASVLGLPTIHPRSA